MIRSTRPGELTTETISQTHTEWPCIPGGHPIDQTCADAIRVWAGRRGRLVVTDAPERFDAA